MWIDQQVLEECREQISFKVFIPESPLVVLGNGNAKEEANLKQCHADGVQVYRRCGGGGAVILHSGCLIVSVGAWVQDPFKNDMYFRMLNDSLSEAVALVCDVPLQHRGISDLAYGDQKVVGTSLFRSRRYVLYQASILVDRKVDLMEMYLPYPSREPDYRKGRQHRDFVIGLDQVAKGLTATQLQKGFEQNYGAIVKRSLQDELIEVPDRDLKNVQQRLDRLRLREDFTVC